MHFFICTRFAQKSLSRNSAGQECPLYRDLSIAGRLCEKKKRRTRAKPPRPPAGKNFRSLILETSLPRRLGGVHNFFAPAYRRQVFARVKKKYFAREAAKTLRPSAGKNFRSLILETSLPRRLGVVHNFFAPAFRRQVFAEKKKK
jgi:hypothetical protein